MLYIDNSLSNAKKTLKEIQLLLHERVLYPPSTWFSIYNLLNGILQEKEKFNHAENIFSAALILSMLSYGDQRGKSNDAHDIMKYPT